MTPKLSSLILCDGMHANPTTGKHIIVGTFYRIGYHTFPFGMPPFTIYVALTNGHGVVHNRIEIVEDDDVTIIAKSNDFIITLKSPLETGEAQINFPAGIPIRRPGALFLKLYSNGEALEGRRIEVIKTAPHGVDAGK